MNSPSMYYRRDGTPYEGENASLQWAKDFTEKNKRVALTELPWGGRVSTVWLGLNHTWGGDEPPLIFESMVFSKDDYGELDMERYPTEEEALVGHKRLVKKWRKGPGKEPKP